MASERFIKARGIPHHFNVSVAAHSVDAAERALDIYRLLTRCGIHANKTDVVRASLLHDIGMTIDEVFQSIPKIKAHTHPVEGARIARDEYDANDNQLDAILFHMWPIGGVSPHSLAGWIILAADKWSFLQETRRCAARTIARRVVRKRKGTS